MNYVIFNADDFGASTGINRGIIECHINGILTSTSMMVTGKAVDEAVRLSVGYPDLGIGLHFDVWGEDEREFDLSNHAALREEFRIQLDQFQQLMGRMPTHIDSHRHAHQRTGMLPIFRELVDPLGVPLRDSGGPVHYVGHFYAQWEWEVTDLDLVSVPTLQAILREQIRPGWNEVACHPGYKSDSFFSVYLAEREVEVRTLTDSKIKQTLAELDLKLVNYAEFNDLNRSKGPEAA